MGLYNFKGLFFSRTIESHANGLIYEWAYNWDFTVCVVIKIKEIRMFGILDKLILIHSNKNMFSNYSTVYTADKTYQL